MPRHIRVPSFAKVNLSLLVLHKRPDGFHELRTLFQTISLRDDLEICFTPGRRLEVRVECEPEIPDNLAARAVRALDEEVRVKGEVCIRLRKRIPLGGGLGGGSSNAASVLLALPYLAGLRVPFARLMQIAASLGSDVPFFLLGGTALGLGRGEELYPLPDVRPQPLLVVTPPISVATGQAYKALGRTLTSEPSSSNMNIFRSLCWEISVGAPAPDFAAGATNDFEPAVFAQHPELSRLKRQLERLGARPALLSGSGASLFGLFESKETRDAAALRIAGARVFRAQFVGRRHFRNAWFRALGLEQDRRKWPAAWVGSE